MESAGMDFHKRVYQGFDECLGQEKNVLRLDATRSIEDLHQEILGSIRKIITE